MIYSIKKQIVAKLVTVALLYFGFNVAAHAYDLPPNQSPLVLTVPGAYTYGDSFNGVASGSSFTDLFEFTITPANFSTAATTIALDSMFGISGLKATLFSGIGTGGTNLLSGWSATIATSPVSELTMFSLNSLAAGTYTLAVKGNFISPLTGLPTTGGFYGGGLNLTVPSPVPEPSPRVAILAGLGLLGFQLSRKLKSHS